MKRLICVALLLFSGFWLAACSPQNPVLTPEQFTQEMVQRMQKQRPDLQFAAKGPLHVQVKRQGQEQATAFFDNAYNAYKSDPQNKQAVMEQYTAALIETVQSNKNAKIDKTLIVPVIKDKAWPEEIRKSLQASGKGDKPPAYAFDPYNEELLVLYAEDTDNNIRYLDEQQIEEAGVPRSELRALAVANLKRLLPEVALQKGDGVLMVTAGGTYEASLLLLDEIWIPNAIAVQGDVVVGIPARDLLLVTGSQTPGGVDKLRQVVNATAQDANYKLTNTLFVRRNGRFEVLR